MRFFAGPTLLVIDELGYLPLPGEAVPALMPGRVPAPPEHLSIVLTTNRGVASWGEGPGDTTVAAAMYRPVSPLVVLNLDGDSYRLPRPPRQERSTPSRRDRHRRPLQ